MKKIILVLAMLLLATPLWGTEILIIRNGGTENDVASILSGAGMSTTITVYDYQWDGTNPPPDNFDAVVLLNGFSGWEEGMPTSGQTALINYVQNGGGLLITEWVAYEYSEGRYTSMGDLIILRRTSGDKLSPTYEVVQYHDVTANLPPTFTLPEHASNVGYAVAEATVLITASGVGDAVVIREYGDGRIVQFAMAGNYDGANPWDANMQQLLINAVEWIALSPCDLKVHPPQGFNSSGYERGPFIPDSDDYTLTNNGTSLLTWETSTTCSWLDLNPSGGNLPAGDNTTVTVSVNALADNLEPGIYSGKIIFRDLTSDCNVVRNATLEVVLEPILEVPIPDTARVVDYDDGIYVVGTNGGDLYVLNEAGEYTVTTLDAGFIYDVRIEYPFIAVVAGRTVIELSLDELTPVELWRHNVGDDMRSVDLSEDGGYVAYLSKRYVGVIQNGSVVADYYLLGSSSATNWLDATADMQYIAITDEPCPPGPGGTQTGVELYEFDGSSLALQWGVVLMNNYETVEVRVSDAKDYVAAATSSGTFMKALDMTDGSLLWEYETPGKEQFACDGDDNLNYVIGATQAWSPPYPWFILSNLGVSGYEVIAEGSMTGSIVNMDSTPDASYLAFGSNEGEFILLSRSDDAVDTVLEGNVDMLIDAIEIGGISLLVGGDGFINLYPSRKEVAVDIDIKPGSCPNPLNVRSKGILAVAILGSEEFDVNTIDRVSLRLADVAPVRSSYEDVAGPVLDANDCNCTTDGPDGYIDLTLKFRTQEIVEQLIDMPGGLADGQTLGLNLSGELFDDTGIVGSDCVVLVGNVSKWLEAKRWDGNEDGVVNLLDLAELAEYWLQSSTLE